MPGHVVLCGSRRALPRLRLTADELAAEGVQVTGTALLADDAEGGGPERKSHLARRHMQLIVSERCVAVLAVCGAHGEPQHYLGPGVIGDLAVAFCAGKPAFALTELPSGCRDELRAWGVQALHGDLRPVIAAARL